jgi:hemolysin activation/secretion protein
VVVGNDLLNFHSLNKTGIVFLWIFAAVLLAGNSSYAAVVGLPDAAQPGGAQAGAEFRAPVPPNMRKFLPKSRRDNPVKKPTRQTLIDVQKIVLQGVVNRPDFDISINELVDFVENQRQQQLQRGMSANDSSPRLDGSPDIRDNFMKKIEKMATDAESDADLQDLEKTLKRYRKTEKKSATLTLPQLQEIAAKVAQYYRDRGFFLVRAYIPPQTIATGIVRIRIVEGTLGGVTIEKNHKYREDQLLQPFRDLVGQPVNQATIEEAMLLLNDYPGLDTFAVFRPGIQAGETNLLISVLEEQLGNTQVHTDNYGSKYTGEYRSRIDFHINKPSSAIDNFTLSLSKTFMPSNGGFWALSYERRAFGPENIFGIGVSKNKYSLGGVLEPFGISGDTTTEQIYWRRSFQRSRSFNLYGLLQFSHKSAKLDITEGEDRADELTVLSAETGFDWATATRSHLASGRVQYSQGFDGLLGSQEPTNDPTQTKTNRRGGSGNYAAGKFTKINVDYNHWFNINRDNTLHFSFRSQFSDDLLTSLEQMPIGGPNSVRAYAASEYLRDRAFSTSLEWLQSAPGFTEWKSYNNRRWGDTLKVALFVDYAKGWLNDPLASEREVVSLSGIGAGLRLNFNNFSARFDVSKPTGDEVVSNDRSPQYYFEMNYGFY